VRWVQTVVRKNSIPRGADCRESIPAKTARDVPGAQEDAASSLPRSTTGDDRAGAVLQLVRCSGIPEPPQAKV